jgi:hypothetical protein
MSSCAAYAEVQMANHMGQLQHACTPVVTKAATAHAAQHARHMIHACFPTPRLQSDDASLHDVLAQVPAPSYLPLQDYSMHRHSDKAN